MRTRTAPETRPTAFMRYVLWSVTAFLVVLPLTASAARRPQDPVTFELSAAAGRLSGDTTYQIGGSFRANMWPYDSGEIHFPLSELKFPLDVYTATVGARLRVLDRLEFRAAVTANVTDDAGKMKDSDWGYYYLGYGPPFQNDTLDIYSESDAVLTALAVQTDARYYVLRWKWVSLGAGIGYRYQNFQYDVKNLVQEYPSDVLYFRQSIPPDVVPGKIGTYEVTYQIPYLQVVLLSEPLKGLTLSADLGYSPLTTAKDDDDHMLRFKRNKGDCDGTATIFETAARYSPVKWFFVELGFSLTMIETEGTQTQTWYRTTDEANAGDSLSIDQKIESRQRLANLTVGFTF